MSSAGRSPRKYGHAENVQGIGIRGQDRRRGSWSVRRHVHSRKFLASDHADEQRKLLTGCLSGRVSLVWPARVIDTRLSLAQIGEADAYR